MLLRAVIYALLAASAVTSTEGPAQRRQISPLKVRLEVSKKVSALFILKDRAVFLKNGVEITLLRGCQVDLLAVDQDLAFGVQADPGLPADVLRLHVQHRGEFPGLLAIHPKLVAPGGQQHLGMHVPYVSFSYSGLGAAGSIIAQINIQNPPNAADWEKVRLQALSQLDAHMRASLGEGLLKPARLSLQEKAGWYLENPYPFVISGHAELAAGKQQGQRIPFRLEAESPRQWIDTERFLVRDLVLSAPGGK